MKIILASQSPRRKELLAELVADFKVEPADIDEAVRKNEAPLDYVQRMAAEKAESVAAFYPQDLVIASDTTVVCQNEIFGKPQDRKEAFLMLSKMSGKDHWVHTAVTLQRNNQQSMQVVSTKVTFQPLTPGEINAYLDTKEYEDKAGAYGIQGSAKRFVKEIEGDFYGVVGFPVSTVYRMLQQFTA